MKKDNSKTILIVLVIILSVWVLALSFYCLYIVPRIVEGAVENTKVQEENKNKENNLESNIITKNIEYKNEPVYLKNDIIEFENNTNNKNKFLNITINNITLGENSYTFKFMEHPYSCTESMSEYKDTYNSFYINDKKIYHQYNQACYLERITFVTDINDEYIAIYFNSQPGNYMNVYDKDINLVDKLEVLDVEVVNDEIIYKNYEEDDELYLINTYTYEMVEGKPIKKIKEKGTESYCNEMTGEGYCEQKNTN